MSELILGDYPRLMGMMAVVVGKSAGSPNVTALETLDIDLESTQGQCLENNGLVPFEAYSGLHPDLALPHGLGCNTYLRTHGLVGDNSWERWANSAIDQQVKELVVGVCAAGLAACVSEEHSETVFITRRVIEFLDFVDDTDSWCLHLSYIKSHWSYLAPEPYHAFYDQRNIALVVCHK